MGKKNAALKEKEKYKESLVTEFLVNAKSNRKIETKRKDDSIYNVDTYLPIDEIESLKSYMVRPYDNFKFKTKSKDNFRLNKEVCSYLFEKFQVPPFIRPKMAIDISIEKINGDGEHNCTWGNAIQWYITVSQGGSLYKKYFKGLLSKKETHSFISQKDIEDIGSAIVYSVALSNSDNYSLSTLLAKTKIGEFIEQSMFINCNDKNEIYTVFRKNKQKRIMNEYFYIVRLFSKMTEKYKINEVNDIFDYLNNRLSNDLNYTVIGKGYNLSILKKATDNWHYELQREKLSSEFANKSWQGFGFGQQKLCVKDINKDLLTFCFSEILDGKTLHKEGKIQRHCVYSYLPPCVSGTSTIVRLHTEGSSNKSLVTLEIRKGTYGNFTLVQARRFANMAPKNQEKEIIIKWSNINKIKIEKSVFLN